MAIPDKRVTIFTGAGSRIGRGIVGCIISILKTFGSVQNRKSIEFVCE